MEPILDRELFRMTGSGKSERRRAPRKHIHRELPLLAAPLVLVVTLLAVQTPQAADLAVRARVALAPFSSLFHGQLAAAGAAVPNATENSTTSTNSTSPTATTQSATTTIVNNYITQPVVERMVSAPDNDTSGEHASDTEDLVTQASLTNQLNALQASLLTRFSAPVQPVPQQVAAGGAVFSSAPIIAPAVNNITNVTVTGGINGLTAADIPDLSASYFKATSTISIAYGGTGTSTAPAAHRLLLSDANGRWEYVSTSSLGIASNLVYAYPLVKTNSTLSLAFGTTTSNLWGGTQTFTNAPIFAALTGGGLAADSTGHLYTFSTSTWRFASSTLLLDNNRFTGTNAFQKFSATFASTTQISSLGSAYFATAGGRVGIGTTTPGSALSVGNTNGINFSTATSTFNTTGGINIKTGCFAVNGVCLGKTDKVTVLSAINTYSPTSTTAKTQYTWTKPANLVYVTVDVWGGGGGGGYQTSQYGAGGGGSSAFGSKIIVGGGGGGGGGQSLSGTITDYSAGGGGGGGGACVGGSSTAIGGGGASHSGATTANAAGGGGGGGGYAGSTLYAANLPSTLAIIPGDGGSGGGSAAGGAGGYGYYNGGAGSYGGGAGGGSAANGGAASLGAGGLGVCGGGGGGGDYARGNGPGGNSTNGGGGGGEGYYWYDTYNGHTGYGSTAGGTSTYGGAGGSGSTAPGGGGGGGKNAGSGGAAPVGGSSGPALQGAAGGASSKGDAGGSGNPTGSGGTGGGGSGSDGLVTVYTYTATTSYSGADLAELYPVDDPTISAGDIVTVNRGLPITMSRAVANSGRPLAGIISTSPGVLLKDKDSTDTGRPVALAGRVPTKVNLEGGPIKIGDRIAVSSVPGVGKKATSLEDSVGIALEPYDGTGTSTIKVLIDLERGTDVNAIGSALLATSTSTSSPSFVDQLVSVLTGKLFNPIAPSSTTTATTTATTHIAVNSFLSKLFAAITGWLADANNGIGDIFATAVHAVTGNFTNLISMTDTTQKLCIGSTCLNESQLKSLLAGQGGGGSTQTAAAAASGGAPVIEIQGANPAHIALNSSYVDLGARITGPTQADTNLGLSYYVDGKHVQSVSINTASSSTHTIDYVATNSFGTATSTRTVIVEAPSSNNQTTNNTQATSTQTTATTTATTTPTTQQAGQATTSTPVATSTASSSNQ